MIRRYLTTALIIAGLAATLTVPSVAQASPVAAKKARLRAVQARLNDLGMQVEKAVERYNQAAGRLRVTRAKISQNKRLLAASQRQLELARRQLTARARDIYKTPQTNLTDVVFHSRSFEDLVAQLDLLQRVGNRDVELVTSVKAEVREIHDRRLALVEDEKAAGKLLAQRQTEKQDILAREASMKRVEDGLQSDIRHMMAAQQQAAASAAQQAAASARAAVANSYSDSSGGSGSVVDPGGRGHPEVIPIAQRYLGIPYLWGGASPKTGFDCSGLTMYVYAQVGIGLAHGATDQQRASRPVPLNALQPGDLVFYGNASYSYHVAIYVGGGRTIEAARTGTNVRYGYVGSAWIGGRF